MKFTSKIIMLMVLALGLILAGCSGDEGSTSVSTTNPNPDTVSYTGKVQGRIVDRYTRQPIVGAVVDIGVGKSTTNSDGVFVISDVPANQSNNGGWDGSGAGGFAAYQAVIDMSKVTSPINQSTNKSKMATDAAVFVYPDFDYATVSVTFNSLDDSSPDNNAAAGASTNSTNHDTPVNNLVASMGEIKVGKLAATIKGVLCDKNSRTLLTGEGWTVSVIYDGTEDDSGVGIAGRVISSQVVNATTGEFSFSRLESLEAYKLKAVNTAQTFIGEEQVKAPGDGITKVLVVQDDDATWDNETVCVSRVDAEVPVIITESPEDGSNVGDVATIDAKFKFNEPIAGCGKGYNDPANKLPGAISNVVDVTFSGQIWLQKSGNVAFTVAWNTTCDELTVSIPALAKASVYKVSITKAFNGTANAKDDMVEFKDAKSNTVVGTGPKDGVISFFTGGAGTLTAPTTVTVLNKLTIDWNTAPEIDWNVVSGAKAYSVYRHCDELWPGQTTSTIPGQWVKLDRTGIAGSSDHKDSDNILDGAITAYELVEARGWNDIALSCIYKVCSIGADNSEVCPTTATSEVTVIDVAKPEMTSSNISALDASFAVTPFLNGVTVAGSATQPSIVITFDEPLLEENAENVANYVINTAAPIFYTTPTTTPKISKATYKCTNTPCTVTKVLLEFGDATAPWDGANLKTAYINAGANGVCQYDDPASISDDVAGDVGTVGTGTRIAGAAQNPDRVVAMTPSMICIYNVAMADATHAVLANTATVGSAVANAANNLFGDDQIIDAGVANAVGNPVRGTVNAGTNGVCETKNGAVAGNEAYAPLDINNNRWTGAAYIGSFTGGTGKNGAKDIICMKPGRNLAFDYIAGADDTTMSWYDGGDGPNTTTPTAQDGNAFLTISIKDVKGNDINTTKNEIMFKPTTAGRDTTPATSVH